ncbi:MAG: hypothetical protein JNL01_06315 [Bdellovibrionales bacterium]|nr:hypothetical protein [Bdellovibrionales bacterium]
MKKLNRLTAVLALGAIIIQTASPAFAQSQGPAENGASKVKKILKSTKSLVLVEGKSDLEAQNFLKKQLAEQNVTTTDIISYVNQNGSAEEREIFNQALNKSKGMNPDSASVVLNQIGLREMKKGSNFNMSCGAGLGIGIPLTLAGLITGIVYLANLSKPDEIAADYIDKRNNATADYISKKGTLEVQLASANQKIAVSKAAITELERKIESGYYGINEEQEFYAQIAKLNSDIVAQENLAGGTTASIQILNAQYDNTMDVLSQKEVSEARIAKKQNDVLPYVAVPTILIGIPFIILGATAGDC